MRELPTGTVTMLFSDIEGSTALLSRLGDRYGGALSAQRTLLRDAAILERFLAPARASMPRQAWDTEMATGRALSQQQAAELLMQEASMRDAPVLRSG